jgi:hypothetical protein
VTFTSLQALVAELSSDPDVTRGLNDKLAAAAAATNPKVRNKHLDAFVNLVNAQNGKALKPGEAHVLILLSAALR